MFVLYVAAPVRAVAILMIFSSMIHLRILYPVSAIAGRMVNAGVMTMTKVMITAKMMIWGAGIPAEPNLVYLNVDSPRKKHR